MEYYDPSPLSNSNKPHNPRRRIAILSSFVSKDANALYNSRYGAHLINKACYADLWGYDFIYNTSWGFPEEIRGRNHSNNNNNNNNNNKNKNSSNNDTRLCFLDWGHWHRVPHMIALAENKEKDYEWILWADNDYVFWDLTQPLEALLQELKVNNLHNVHVVAPDDGWEIGTSIQFAFSSFALLIRNSHFGRTVLRNWMTYAGGICPNGNFADVNGCQNFNWKFTDQPGLWYALAKTYSDLVEGSGEFVTSCNNESGYHEQADSLSLNMTEYFTREGLIKSPDYSDIPKDQPILWSSYTKNTRSGIGVNQDFIRKATSEEKQGILGHHVKELSHYGKLQQSQLRYCEAPITEGGQGCRVGPNQQGVFDLSCGNTSYVVWDSYIQICSPI